MSLSLYWMPISQPARAVAWALSHEGVEFESINVMPGKETRVRPAPPSSALPVLLPPWLQALNACLSQVPDYMEKSGGIGTVPMIDDNGFFLSESHAILTYLGDKMNWKTYPKDLKIRAKIQARSPLLIVAAPLRRSCLRCSLCSAALR